jgi:hypothetical protein
VILLSQIEDNWIVTPRRYRLNPVKWQIMNEHAPIDYEKLLIIEKPDGRRKFSGVEWRSRTKERAHITLDESMCLQGSCWVMARSWWDKVIMRLDSFGYGTHYQDTTEMLFKTWNAGGKLMVNKRTWFAHKSREFNRTHNYPGDLAQKSWTFALNLWTVDYERIRKQWNI